MRNILIKGSGYLLVLPLMLVLCSCSTPKAAVNAALTWQIQVSSHVLKDNLKTIETVTQYNGSKIDVVHQQSPSAGNIYVIMDLTISKNGSASDAFNWQDLVIKDAAGNSYNRLKNDTFLEQHKYTPRMTGLEIRFGVNEGWACYEIPSQAASGSLILAYTALGSQQEIILQK
jgi:hypothetical protein